MGPLTSRHAFWLSVFTVAYNVLEAAFSILFSLLDGSAALLGFGADSVVESLSGAIMIWLFWDSSGSEARERRAARLVGVTFLILAGYVVYESASSLIREEPPQPSLAAIVIACASLLVMPLLFLAKQRTAIVVRSRSLRADSKQTLACILLSVALLLGAGLNYWLGIWQADPIAGLVISSYLLFEGYEALTTEELCEC